MHTIDSDRREAYLIGGGIASLSAAVYLIRDGRFPGESIHILEEARLGGCLDASGSPEQGYSMRGTRMYGPAYVLMHELLSGIPSLDDPARSVTQDTLEFWQAAPWDDRARLVEDGRIVDPAAFGLNNTDRVHLIALLLRDEDVLGSRRIDACFEPHFFQSNFWFMWCGMFGFETWHSAAELRRYLLRFLRLFPHLATMNLVQSTRYNGYDSIVRPLVHWLRQRGVRFREGVQVTDLDFAPVDGDRKAVRRLRLLCDGQPAHIDVAARDLVIVTLGSMTADSSVGSMTAPPARVTERRSGAWSLWERLAAKDPAFGRPAAFCGNVDLTKWVTFTVTEQGDRFASRMERFSARPPGRGGLVTLKSSNWLLTFHLFHPPAFAEQPPGTHVWWGYGLFADRVGNYVKKTMCECTGREILIEVFSHLGWQDDIPALLECANCIPCLLPYTTSQFMPREKGDRPQVIPPGTVNLAFVGQYCEIPDNVVFTVEYSVNSAALAVASLLGFPDRVPRPYRGLEHPNALIGAMKCILDP